MSGVIERLRAILGFGGAPDRVVPPTGVTARLTVFSAAAMAFLAVFALALASTAGRLGAEWRAAFAESATIRLPDPSQTEAVLALLRTTPGVAAARALSPEETEALLEPWFGPDLPVEELPLPALIAIGEDGGFDPEALRIRLAAEASEAVLDDHGRWRAPMVAAAARLRWLAALSALLIGGATAAIITLAANAALAANAQPIRVLRLVGARDDYIAQAFVRRFARRALIGALAGTAAGVAAILLLPQGEAAALPAFGFSGAGWMGPALVPVVAAGLALAASRRAALRTLRAIQ